MSAAGPNCRSAVVAALPLGRAASCGRAVPHLLACCLRETVPWLDASDADLVEAFDVRVVSIDS